VVEENRIAGPRSSFAEPSAGPSPQNPEPLGRRREKTVSIDAFLTALTEWASARSDIRGAALIGDLDDGAPFANLHALVLSSSFTSYRDDQSLLPNLGVVSPAGFDDSSARFLFALAGGSRALLRVSSPTWFADAQWRVIERTGIVPLLDRDGQFAAALAAAVQDDCEIPPRSNITYDEWLALSPDQQDKVRRTWNPYQHENIHIPREASRRFLAQCDLPCAGVDVGVYHGGIYIICAKIKLTKMSEAEIKALGNWRKQPFDGFPVMYERARRWW
jgi:hypothetical protein